MKGKYVFLEANEEEKAQAEMLAKGLDGPRKIFWRLREILPESQHHDKLEVFHKDLIKFNQKINLISQKTVFDADILHFLDSYLAAEFILEDCNAEQMFDFGSGNGFPGLVMAILAPNRRFILVDTDKRKLEFIKYIATKLALKNVATHNIDISKIAKPTVEAAVCRGLGSVTRTLLLARKSFKMNANFYHLKGPSWSNEIGELPSQLLSFWLPKLVSEYKLSNNLGDRFIVKTTLRA